MLKAKRRLFIPRPAPPFIDPYGNELTKYGLLNSTATYLSFVCFDYHPKVGQQIHIMEMRYVKKIMRNEEDAGFRPVRAGVGTGYGYLKTPEELQAESYPLPKEVDASGTIAQRSVRLTRRLFRSLGYDSDHVSRSSQHNQMDLKMTNRKDDDDFFWVEVKSREEDKSRYPRIFLQTHESNPFRIYK